MSHQRAALPRQFAEPLVWLVSLALVTACATQSEPGTQESRIPQNFQLEAVYHECVRLRCAEPNAVVAGHFVNIMRTTGAGCIVHILPENGQTNWAYWDNYVAALRAFLPKSQMSLHAYGPEGLTGHGGVRRAEENLKLLEAFYAYNGAPTQAIRSSIIGESSAFVPPYQHLSCAGRPVLEISGGARLVSPVATWAAEHIVATNRATRTVVVSLEMPQ